MTTDRDFLLSIEVFLETSGMSASRFGKLVVGDPNFVLDVRAGRSPSLKIVARVMDFIEGHDARPTPSPRTEAA